MVELELGDSWIHGTASDPGEARPLPGAAAPLRRASPPKASTPPRRAFGRGLTLVAEHTWGVDIKSYLRDEAAWDRPAFEAARAADPRFAYTEASWAEQRAYLDAAVAALAPADRERAAEALAATDAASPAGPRRRRRPSSRLDGWRDRARARHRRRPRHHHPRAARRRRPVLIGYRHESYDAADVARHMDTYLTHREEWAILDHDKPGLARAATARSAAFAPVFRGTAAGRHRVAEHAAARPADALGAPPRVELAFAPAADGLLLTLRLRDKPANRMPEAGFLSFCPEGAAGWRFLKTGLWLPAARVAAARRRPPAGGLRRRGHASGGRHASRSCRSTPPLVAPGGRRLHGLRAGDPPDFARGIRFNLYNNKWGTNFPMWWEGTLTARFLLEA